MFRFTKRKKHPQRMLLVTFKDVKTRLKKLGLGSLRSRRLKLDLPMPRHWSQDLGPEQIKEIARVMTERLLSEAKQG